MGELASEVLSVGRRWTSVRKVKEGGKFNQLIRPQPVSRAPNVRRRSAEI
jgi:hypothetical protein